MERRNVAGMSMKGGRKDLFYMCLLEFFPEKNRWFLASMLKVKDVEGRAGDEAIRSWIENFKLHQLVVDTPISSPACQTCDLVCPGADECPVGSVKAVRDRIHDILDMDQTILEANPKAYERDRNRDDEYDFHKDVLNKDPTHHMLSRSFKRRLKKGFLPYWNRSLDLWVWSYYYDQLLDLFNVSYDSFGNTSLMLQSRFSYLRRHFPADLELFEGNVQIALIELLRSGIIMKRDLVMMNDMEEGIEARLDVIKRIEDKLNIFIYEKDLELICKHPRAFDSFMMAVIGQNKHMGRSRNLPDWTLPEDTKFLAPSF